MISKSVFFLVSSPRNCLFRALADQLEGNHKLHHKYRMDTVHFMRRNSPDFAPFHDESTMSFEKYCKYKKVKVIQVNF